MPRHTKIVATLGPASSSPDILERLVHAGIDVVRMNFSHGTPEDHIARAEGIRDASALAGRPVGILADLQGPKIRIGKFEDQRITLARDDEFILDAGCTSGNRQRVGLDYRDLPRDVKPGDVLLLDDGRLKLRVERVLGAEIRTRVLVGGELSNNKGINRQGGGLTAPALTAKDMDDIKTAARIGVDFVAVSFPKSAADMYMARQLLRAAGSSALLIAKIERTEAVTNLNEILDASDGIMVARGDLAVEVGDAAVPALQKKMLRAARERNKLTITATQMMESMIHSPVPTRAEVSDVANAVLDGTDAVMLSAETAAGEYPVEVVEAMSRVCLEAEKSAADAKVAADNLKVAVEPFDQISKDYDSQVIEKLQTTVGELTDRKSQVFQDRGDKLLQVAQRHNDYAQRHEEYRRIEEYHFLLSEELEDRYDRLSRYRWLRPDLQRELGDNGPVIFGQVQWVTGNSLQINKGRRDGVELHQKFTIMRNGSTIAVVDVVEVQNETAECVIVDQVKSGAGPKAGDQSITRMFMARTSRR